MPLFRFGTVAAKQMAAPTAQRTVLFRGRPSELHVWIKTASCNVLWWKNLTWSTKTTWRRGRGGRGDKMKMPQTVERTARQAGSSFGSTPLRAFSRIARSFAHSLTERPRPRPRAGRHPRDALEPKRKRGPAAARRARIPKSSIDRLRGPAPGSASMAAQEGTCCPTLHDKVLR